MASPFDRLPAGKLRPQGFNAADLKAELATLAAELKKQIQAEVSGLDENPTAIARRRAWALQKDGFEYFCRTYFPHYVRSDSASSLHRHLFSRLPEVLAAAKGQREGIIAPRGEAKSTFGTQLFTLWCMALHCLPKEERWCTPKHYIMVIMDSFAQAAGMVEAVKVELEANPRLKLDFPEICGAGATWREGEAITVHGVKLDGVGAGMKLRGRRHGPHRPDLVIMDDIENDEAVASKEQRDKLEKWVDKAVLNLGSADGTMDALMIGTVLHTDAVIMRKLRSPGWRFVRLRSIVTWPDRMDLWEQWEAILRSFDPTDPEDKDRAAEDAGAFYAEHQEEMERGAEVSWPEVRPLLALMELRVRIGRAAFASEQQNAPADNEDAPFKRIHFWTERRAWIFAGACDPSLGRSDRKGDPSAIIVVGLDRETGLVDVVEASIRRRVPTVIMSDIIALQREFRCPLWGIETVQFQAFFMSELVAKSAEQGVPVPAMAITHEYPKDLRIMSLEPHIANGVLRLHQSQTVLLEQLQQYPLADHDDGPDALEMAWRVVGMLRGGRDILVGGQRMLVGQAGRYAEPGVPESGLMFGAEPDPMGGWAREIGGFIR